MIGQRAGWKVLKRPDFGWTMATQFATADCHTDLLGEEPYRWIRHAVRLLERPGMEHGNDPDLLAVHQAMRFDNQPGIRRLLNAALLAFDATVERLADAITFPVGPVEAYAPLFFDVLDRKDDPAFLHAAVRAGNHSFLMLKATRECVINIPTAELAEKVVGCGNTTGADIDKFMTAGERIKLRSKMK